MERQHQIKIQKYIQILEKTLPITKESLYCRYKLNIDIFIWHELK